MIDSQRCVPIKRLYINRIVECYRSMVMWSQPCCCSNFFSPSGNISAFSTAAVNSAAVEAGVGCAKEAGWLEANQHRRRRVRSDVDSATNMQREAEPAKDWPFRKRRRHLNCFRINKSIHSIGANHSPAKAHRHTSLLCLAVAGDDKRLRAGSKRKHKQAASLRVE